MLPTIDPRNTRAWKLLQEHFAEISTKHLRELFREEPDRFSQFSYCLDELVVDLSRNIITGKTMELLQQLASECRIKESISAMFNGDLINGTEKRSVLHTALRNFSDQPVYSEGADV